MRWALSVLLVAACGDGGVALVDGHVTPDSPDGRGLVTVQFLQDRGSQGGLPVYFQNADSSLVLATRTLDDGSANAYMASGGFVTIVSPGFASTWTFADVQAGDRLVLDRRLFGGDTTDITVSTPPPPSADGVTLVTPCGSGDLTDAHTHPAMVTVGRCGNAIDLLVMSTSSLDSVTRYLYRDAVPFGPGAVTMGGPYRPFEPSTLYLLHAPRLGIAFEQSVYGSDGRLFTRSDFAQPPSGSMISTVDMPLAPSTTLVTDAYSTDFGNDPVQHVLQWEPSSGRTEIDLAERMYTMTSRPVFDPTSYTVMWTEDPTGVPPNTVLAVLLDGFDQWHVLAPRGPDPLIRRPVLPGHGSADFVSLQQLTTIAITGGFRAAPAGLVDWQLGTTPPITGPSGHLIYEQTPGLFGGGGVELRPTP